MLERDAGFAAEYCSGTCRRVTEGRYSMSSEYSVSIGFAKLGGQSPIGTWRWQPERIRRNHVTSSLGRLGGSTARAALPVASSAPSSWEKLELRQLSEPFRAPRPGQIGHAAAEEGNAQRFETEAPCYSSFRGEKSLGFAPCPHRQHVLAKLA